jgi:hypothetical protein
MMILYRFQPHQEYPTETHEAEQRGYFIAGNIILRLPDDSREFLLGAGE